VQQTITVQSFFSIFSRGGSSY